ncbi:MAG: ROK family transcriptional regulator [Lachnospiraceae bacterium]|nr:ROK family transcriptional regulator [Lachnospiraceae bacterium]
MGDNITERRRMTRNRMYRLIYNSKNGISKQQIAEDMGCSLPTVHQNIAELLEADLIRQGELQPSSGGRPATGYVTNDEIGIAVGISVSAKHIRFTAVDIKLKVLGTLKLAVDFASMSKTGKIIASELEKFIDDNSLDRRRLLGVGITIPAVIDKVNDIIMISPTLNVKNTNIRELVEKIPYPVYVDNDGTCAGAAEAFSGRRSDFAYLFMEYGIGGAIYMNGKKYAGLNNRSAEFGHICVHPGGLKCSCGKRGCLEAYCGALRFTKELGVSVDEFFKELENGDKDYEEIWNDVLSHLASGINIIRMIFDGPVILGGFVSEYIEPYLPKLREMAAEKNTFEKDGNYILLGKYYKNGGMMGSASHFIEKFIDEI